jgi:hypothetical protein
MRTSKLHTLSILGLLLLTSGADAAWKHRSHRVSNKPTPTPQVVPTPAVPSVTPTPVSSPQAQPTVTPTPTPTPTPVPIPTVTPTPRPTPVPGPTPVPTSIPVSSAQGWWHPTPGNAWQIQYTGTINTSLPGVTLYDLDVFDTSSATIASIHNAGGKVICYFSAGTYENWRPDANQFPASVLGSANGWPGEKWLDVRQLGVLEPIMAARIAMAQSKGCDALDPDNVDGYTNSTGFSLNANDQAAFNTMLAKRAHAAGMAVGLKNDLDQIPTLLSSFDFAVNEQCFQYSECASLLPFISANKPVFNIEYSLSTSQFCSQANSYNFDSLKKNLSLDAARESCR